MCVAPGLAARDHIRRLLRCRIARLDLQAIIVRVDEEPGYVLRLVAVTDRALDRNATRLDVLDDFLGRVRFGQIGEMDSVRQLGLRHMGRALDDRQAEIADIELDQRILGGV